MLWLRHRGVIGQRDLAVQIRPDPDQFWFEAQVDHPPLAEGSDLTESARKGLSDRNEGDLNLFRKASC